MSRDGEGPDADAPPPTLDYAYGQYESRDLRLGENIAVGLIAGVFVNILTVAALFGMPQMLEHQPWLMFAPSALLVIIAAGLALSRRRRGLLAGALLGVGIGCLLPVGAFAALCGGF